MIPGWLYMQLSLLSGSYCWICKLNPNGALLDWLSRVQEVWKREEKLNPKLAARENRSLTNLDLEFSGWHNTNSTGWNCMRSPLVWKRCTMSENFHLLEQIFDQQLTQNMLTCHLLHATILLSKAIQKKKRKEKWKLLGPRLADSRRRIADVNFIWYSWSYLFH